MALTSSCSRVLFLTLCGYSAVQGSQMEMPTIASILQTHMSSHTDTSHHAVSSWKAQAQMFIGLLQSFGKQVPTAKVEDTKNLVDKVLTILRQASDDMQQTAEGDKKTLEAEMNGFVNNVKEYDEHARTSKTATESKSEELAICLAAYREKTTVYETKCSPIPPIPVCVLVNRTQKFTFEVSSQSTWTCNFTDGETDETCAGSSSDLSKDLTTRSARMLARYDEWKDDRDNCTEITTAKQTECDDLSADLDTQKDSCDRLLHEAEELLCDFNTYIQTREEFAEKLNTSMIPAPTLLDPERVQWLDLELIICIFNRFHQNMTFADDDYTSCQAKVRDMAFVSNPTPPGQPLTLSTSVSFGAGLADAFLGETSAANGRLVTVYVHPETNGAEPKLFLKLAEESDGESCGIADTEKLMVSAAGVVQAGKLCSQSASCQFFELGGGNSRMGSADCKPKADATNHYVILKKVCKGGVRVR